MHDFYCIVQQEQENFPSSLLLKYLSFEQNRNVPVSPSGHMNTEVKSSFHTCLCPSASKPSEKLCWAIAWVWNFFPLWKHTMKTRTDKLLWRNSYVIQRRQNQIQLPGVSYGTGRENRFEQLLLFTPLCWIAWSWEGYFMYMGLSFAWRWRYWQILIRSPSHGSTALWLYSCFSIRCWLNNTYSIFSSVFPSSSFWLELPVRVWTDHKKEA